MTAPVRYPILAPDVEIPWERDLQMREDILSGDDDPPLRLDLLEASGCLSPQRPRRPGLIRGLLFVVPVLAVALWVLFVGLP